MFARVADLCELCTHLLRGVHLQRQVGQALDRIQGRANLVAHLGEEFTSALFGQLGLVQSHGKLLCSLGHALLQRVVELA